MPISHKTSSYQSLAAGSLRETMGLLCAGDTGNFACFTEHEGDFPRKRVTASCGGSIKVAVGKLALSRVSSVG